MVDHHGTQVALSEDDVETVYLLEVNPSGVVLRFGDEHIHQDLAHQLPLERGHAKRELQVVDLAVFEVVPRGEDDVAANVGDHPKRGAVDLVLLHELVDGHLGNRGVTVPIGSDRDRLERVESGATEVERGDLHLTVLCH